MRTRGRPTRGCRRRASGGPRSRCVGAGASAAAAEKGGGGTAAEGGAAAREKAVVQYLLDECGFTERVNAQLVVDKVRGAD